MDRIKWVLGLMLTAVMVCDATRLMAGESPLDSAALLADPWVKPPKTPEETQARVAELKAQYAPYLRSLPAKLDLRERRELTGKAARWKSYFELTHFEGGPRPTAPAWFGEGFEDSGWEATSTPEWRWLMDEEATKTKKRWYPASCILWYRTQFESQRPASGRRAFLCFEGVDWEAEVWLNGTFLGRHKSYYEPFRFDVSKLLKTHNTLAVRVFDGPAFGEPISNEAPLPHVPGDPAPEQRYVRGDRSKSFPNYAFGKNMFLGTGFGIHREVWLETAADACVAEVFVRGNPAASEARVRVETDAAAERELEAEVQLLPENCEGAAYKRVEKVRLAKGRGELAFTVAAPGAKWWWPAEPNLYRCRVLLRDGDKLVDAKDALFGFRSFGMVTKSHPMAGQPDGRFVLNGRPVFLRGSNITGAYNAYSYWNEPENLLTASLLLKAANFNAVRSCQHVGFPEVRELFDRLGIMSEQDQGHGSEVDDDTSATVAEMGTVLARVCYNNPGVVLLSFANEIHHMFDATPVVANVLAVDPERIIVPVSGLLFRLDNSKHLGSVVRNWHWYDGWYGSFHKLWAGARTRPPQIPLMLVGEYGGEALDAYETMRDHYPKHWDPVPRADEDKLCGARQVEKGYDFRQQFGLRGRIPKNLGEYIEASQTYQADMLAEATKGFRLSRQAVSGYFQFHFLDGTPARWPKAIVSHDFRPKKGFYEMAQVSQPLVPLYRLAERGQALEIWVVNDLPVEVKGGKIRWIIGAGERRLEGSVPVEVPAGGAVAAQRVDLGSLSVKEDVLDVQLTLLDAQGRTLSEYGREIYRDFSLIDRYAEKQLAGELRGMLANRVNLALNKQVIASSAEAQNPALNAVDGKADTAWRAAPITLEECLNNWPQSLTVDLGQVAKLCGAKILWEGSFAGKARFEVSGDKKTWQPVSGEVREASEPQPGVRGFPRLHYFGFSGEGRYVRVTFTAGPEGMPVGIREFEILGDERKEQKQ